MKTHGFSHEQKEAFHKLLAELLHNQIFHYLVIGADVAIVIVSYFIFWYRPKITNLKKESQNREAAPKVNDFHQRESKYIVYRSRR